MQWLNFKKTFQCKHHVKKNWKIDLGFEYLSELVKETNKQIQKIIYKNKNML